MIEAPKARDSVSIVRALLFSAGLGLLAVSLAWDAITGATEFHFGQKQIVGGFTGIILVVAGAVLGAWRSDSALGRLLSGWGLPILLMVCSGLMAMADDDSISKWAVAGYLAAMCALLPKPFGAVTFLLGGGVLAALSWTSAVKAEVLGLPLTMMDIRIAAAHPTGLMDALGLSAGVRIGVVSLIVAIAAIWLVSALHVLNRVLKGITPFAWWQAIARALCIGLLVVAVFVQMGATIAAHSQDESTWHPQRVIRLAERMGILPFLAFSHKLEVSGTQAPFYSVGDEALGSPSSDEVRLAVARFAEMPDEIGSRERSLPNVVVVLAEGTFDPDAIFRLRGTWDGQMFRPDHQTRASGLLRVNAVGGGTWITEFETIVGLDSRLFGLDGMYTHYSLSPLVTRTFATYLKDHGYEAVAFFGATGEFYNGRNAYIRYGFDRIIDSEDLGRGRWFQDDRTIVEDVVKTLGQDPQAPFFAYIKLLENHAPHECKVREPVELAAYFVDSDEFGPNCLLNDYLDRLANTSSAVSALRAYLQGLERETGRPYVMLVFGDHQPHTFSTSVDNQINWAPMKKVDDPYVTFFRVDSSLERPLLDCCVTPAPAWVLPTLLSAFVARDADDLFLGVNLWLYSECGWDVTGTTLPSNLGDDVLDLSDERSPTCKLAVSRALSAYRSSGILRLSR